MPTIVGILTIMGRITSMLSLVEHEKVYNFRAWADMNKALLKNQQTTNYRDIFPSMQYLTCTAIITTVKSTEIIILC